ncbi:MAG: ATP-binding protein [Caldisericia bacterium]|nr:ATP-binding protein [Caldisericia bacterium]
MFREAINQLIAWKRSAYKKPLIIHGARQVGKTWLMKEFGQKYYQHCAYINFDNNSRMNDLFSGSLDTNHLIKGLQIETGQIIRADNTLLIFDEVQEVPRALTSLKYFNENAPQYDILCAGSLLGITLHSGTSFPVGKVDFMDLPPLTFLEFLRAVKKEQFAQLLETQDFSMIKSFKEPLIQLLKEYLYVGGMPEVVDRYAKNVDPNEVRLIQNNILEAYEQDFSKHAPADIVPRLRLLWRSIPKQLARENRKFVYGLIRQGARAREYELALMWLQDAGLIRRVNRIEKPGIPLSAYQDFSAFKVYFVDTGLLGAMSQLDPKVLLEENQFFTEFKGALTEQYVLQELQAIKNLHSYYWTAQNAMAEVDFVFQWNSHILPLEVKASENLQSKSLKSYVQKYSCKKALRTSLSSYRDEGWLINIPLYAISQLPKIIGE